MLTQQTMLEGSEKKENSGDLVNIDYIALGEKLSSDPKMIEVASFFYSPQELVDLFYLCAQHRAGPEAVKKREEEFEQMLQKKAEEKFREVNRKKRRWSKKEQTESYKQEQINTYRAELAEEILKNRKDVLERIDHKRVEIRNEIKRLESLIKEEDNTTQQPNSNTKQEDGK